MKTNFVPPAHHHPLRAYAHFPALLPIFKCIPEVVFCEGVQHRPRFCLYLLTCVKMAAFLPSIEEAEDSRVCGGRQSCCFRSKIPWRKRRCKTVRCRDATTSSFDAKVRWEVFAHFHAVIVESHSNVPNLLFDLPGRIIF
jgi:hypothetical protein